MISQAGELVSVVGFEIVRRWLKKQEPALYNHNAHDRDRKILRDNGKWIEGVWTPNHLVSVNEEGASRTRKEAVELQLRKAKWADRVEYRFVYECSVREATVTEVTNTCIVLDDGSCLNLAGVGVAEFAIVGSVRSLSVTE